MVWYISRDFLRRNWLVYLCCSAPNLGVWSGVAFGNLPVSFGMLFSFMFGASLGPMMAMTTLVQRELRFLPVSRRDFWLTTCTLGTVAVVTVLLVMKGLAVVLASGFAGATAVPIETVLLSAVYELIFAAVLLLTGPVMVNLGQAHAAAQQPGWLPYTQAIGALTVFAGAMAAPWWFVEVLPLSLSQFTPLTMSVLVAGLLVVAATFAWTPKQLGQVGGSLHFLVTARPSDRVPRPRLLDRFTGLSRIVCGQMSLAMTSFGGAMVLVVGLTLLFESHDSLRSAVEGAGLLLFMAQSEAAGTLDRGIFFGFLFVVSLQNVWTPLALQLKVLPVTAARINALFIATPFVVWAVVWLLLTMLHVAALRQWPDTLRLDWWLGLGGVSALANVASFRWQGALSTAAVLAGAVFLRMLAEVPSASLDWFWMTLGLASTVAAVALNHHTLTRSTSSSKAYQRPRLTLGIATPLAR